MDIGVSNSGKSGFSFDNPYLQIEVDTSITFAGSSNNDQYSLPLNSGGTYNCLVKWGDGTTDTITAWTDAVKLHTYPAPGVYHITISGIFDAFGETTAVDDGKLLNIHNFGDMEMIALGLEDGIAFVGGFTNFPTPVGAGTIVAKFQNSPLFNAPINSSVYKVPSTGSKLLYGCNAFDYPIEDIDFSGVTIVLNLFRDCWEFNQEVNGINFNWGAQTTNMSAIFMHCRKFNKSISSFNTTGKTDFGYLFNNAWAFNQPLTTLDVSSAFTTTNMFADAKAFNQDLSSFNVAGVTDMISMFNGALAFNQDIGAWDVSSLTDASTMFSASTVMSQANADALFIGWTGWTGGVATKSVQSNVPFDCGDMDITSGSDAEDAYNWLIATKLWTITGVTVV